MEQKNSSLMYSLKITFHNQYANELLDKLTLKYTETPNSSILLQIPLKQQ